MPTISYRDALSDVIADPEELEVILDYLQMAKDFGAFRGPRLPSHTLVTLIEKIKSLKEQMLGYYPTKPAGRVDAEADTFEVENPPSVAYSDPE